MRVKVGNKEFTVKHAKEPEELKTGLLKTDKLPRKEGMLFSFPEPGDYTMTMVGMKYPLAMVFANGGKVTRIVQTQPGEDNIIGHGPSDSVLEIHPDDAKDLSVGDELLILGEKQDGGKVEIAPTTPIQPKGTAHVLDENGNVQMNLKGGERIFSRKATSRMFELAKAKEYKKLGRYIINEIEKQDGREPEYADS